MIFSKKNLLIFLLLLLTFSLFACSQNDITNQSQHQSQLDNSLEINPQLNKTEANLEDKKEKINLDKLVINIYQKTKTPENKIISTAIRDLDITDINSFSMAFSEEIELEQKYFITVDLFKASIESQENKSNLLYQGEASTEIIASELSTSSTDTNIKEVNVKLQEIPDDDELEDADDSDKDENNNDDENKADKDKPEDSDDQDGIDDADADENNEPSITILQADNIEIKFTPDKDDIDIGDKFDVEFVEGNDTSFITWTHDLADRKFKQASKVEALEAVDDMTIGVISKDNMTDILAAEPNLDNDNYHEDKLIIDQNSALTDLEEKLPQEIDIYDSISETDTAINVDWDIEDFAINQSGSQFIYGFLDLDETTMTELNLNSQPQISLEIFVRGSSYSFTTEIKKDDSGSDFADANIDEPESNMSGESGQISYVDTEQIAYPPIELEASANSGWRFIQWEVKSQVETDKTHTNNPVEVELTAGEPKTVYAFFRKLYQLESNIESLAAGKGELEINPNFRNYEAGESIEIEAIAKEGSRFVEWDDIDDDIADGIIAKEDDKLTIDSITRNVEFTALFEIVHQIFTRSSPSNSGEIEVAIAEENLTEDNEIYHESEAELEAIPNRGWNFVDWSSDDFTELNEVDANPYTITTVENSGYIFANFERKEYTITTDIQGAGSVEPEEQTVKFEADADLTATADNGWQFIEWTLNNKDEIDDIEDITDINDINSREQRNLTIESVESDLDFTADFEREQYTITANTEGEGSVDPEEQTVEFEADADLTATAEDDWQFDEWTGDIDDIENPESETITIESIESDLELTANFVVVDEEDNNGDEDN